VKIDNFSSVVISEMVHNKTKQQLIRRWDSERELCFNDDIAHT